jgi:putative ABC transport system permease protein
MLLSNDFLRLVLIAFAAPIAWYVADKWLEDFACRIPLTIWIFLLAWLASIVLAFLTVCYQAVRAAIADPVDSLRYE